jgi:Tfp pilus assembly protein PilX
MNDNSNFNDDVNDNDDDNNNGVVLPQQRGRKVSSSSCSTSYSIEVCHGPDCTGLGGGVAELEIEELVREHEHEHHGTDHRIRVVAGGCRNFCSVGPNVHVLVRKKQKQKQKRGKKKRTTTTTTMLESFQTVKDASSCNRVVNNAIAYSYASSSSLSSFDGPADGGNPDNEPPIASSLSSSMNRDCHRSMVARRAERTRWEALKDVSRTIAKCNKVVAASNRGSGSGSDNDTERKQKLWKETCTDRIQRATTKPLTMTTMTSHQSQRDQRRSERLIEIASEKLDRICLQFDNESDSSSSYNSSSSDESDTSDE